MKKIYFIIVLHFCYLFANSQNAIFTGKQEISVNLLTSTYTNNQVINQISKGNNQPVSTVNISSKIFFENTIFKNSNNQVNVQTKIVKIQDQPFLYRQIKLNENVLADNISFSIKIKNKTNQEIKSVEAIDVVLNNNIIFSKLIQLDSAVIANGISFQIQNLQMYYTTNRLNDFVNWSKMVDEYNLALKDVNDRIIEINKIPSDFEVLSNLNQIELNFDYNTFAKKSIELTNSIKNAQFYISLNIQNNDNLGLNQKINELYNKSIKLQNVTANVIQQMDLIYYNKGSLMYQKNLINEAISNFNKSLEINPRFSPSYYMLSYIAFGKNDFSASESYIFKVFELGGDPKLMNDATNLATNLYNNYINFAKNSLNSSKPDNAIIWLNKSEYICSNISSIKCTDELFQLFVNAHASIMNQKISICENSINQNNFDDAIKNIDDAIFYRKQNIKYLQDAQPIVNISTSLYTKIINAGKQKQNEKNYQAALDFYYKAQNFCSNSEFIKCSEELNSLIASTKNQKYENFILEAQTKIDKNDLNSAEETLLLSENYRKENNLLQSPKYQITLNNLKQKQYNQAITNGNNYLKSSKFSEALNQFEYAKEIEKNNKIQSNAKLGEYIKNSAKQLILEKISYANQSVQSNNTQQARVYLQEAQNLINSYTLENDKTIAEALNNANSKVFNQECINAKNNFNQQYIIAQNKIQEKKYIEANNFLNAAIAIATQNLECNLNYNEAQNLKIKIADAFDYETLVYKAEEAYKNRNYETSLVNYQNATGLYYDKNIETRFSLTHKSFDNFIKEKDVDFIFYSIGYFISKEKYDEAFNYLDELRKKNYNSKKTKEYQRILADKLAVRDYLKENNLNPKQKVLEYTKNDKWFSEFSKNYQKTIKKIK